MMYFKELNASGALTGLLKTDGWPEDTEHYKYIKISEDEYTRLQEEMRPAPEPSQLSLEQQITNLQLAIVELYERR